MIDNLLDRPYLCVTLILAFCLLIGWAAVVSESHWQDFAKQHHCTVVRKTSGQYIISFGKGGGHWLPGTTTYRCDDGVEYTR